MVFVRVSPVGRWFGDTMLLYQEVGRGCTQCKEGRGGLGTTLARGKVRVSGSIEE